jgi:nitrogen fixation NifU-like protein
MTQESDLFDELEGLIVEDAKKIFSDTVIDHFMHPRNAGPMEDADCVQTMSGICGDTIGIYVSLNGGTVRRISFVTDGCGPTIACSSAVTCMAEGRPVDEAKKITGKDVIEFLGGLPVENTHCADLAANTLRGALEKAENLS